MAPPLLILVNCFPQPDRIPLLLRFNRRRDALGASTQTGAAVGVPTIVREISHADVRAW